MRPLARGEESLIVGGLRQTPGSLQNGVVVGAHLVVGIGVHPTDRATLLHEKDARNRELVVFLAGCRFEVDSVIQILLHIVVAELKSDSEGARGRERAVGVERVAEVAFLQAAPEPRGLVRADRDDGKPERRELGFDLAQLTELRIAVGSPAAAVEDEQRTRIAGEIR